MASSSSHPLDGSALETSTPPEPPASSSTADPHPPRLSPRNSGSYPAKPTKPLSPRPTSHFDDHASVNGGKKKQHRASFDLHLPTVGLLGSIPAGGHLGTVTSPTEQTEKFHRFPTKPDVSEHNLTLEHLPPGRRRVVEDCLELFCSRPTLEILQRTWRKDATFEDPIAKCHGYHEYAPQWFAMPKAFPRSKTLSLHLHHPSASNPSELVWEQVQEYTIRGLGSKKVVHSLVVVQLDENDMVQKFEDRWDGKVLPTSAPATFLRRVNARVVPWLVHVPKSSPTSRHPSPVNPSS